VVVLSSTVHDVGVGQGILLYSTISRSRFMKSSMWVAKGHYLLRLPDASFEVHALEGTVEDSDQRDIYCIQAIL